MNNLKHRISSTKHNGWLSDSFINITEYASGKYRVQRTTQFSGAKNPSEERKVDEFFIDNEQLSKLIGALVCVRNGFSL